ncbi:hypothetical protein [Richelia sinica]|uniref:hypothetical protein n=1 Tax=Richelia sinica TaxID=1357545 RepID=UPI0018EFB155|nr:hypothetical protein [Richelia sinica]
MTKEIFSTKLSANWVQFLGTTLLSYLVVSTAININPASAAEELASASPNTEVTSAQSTQHSTVSEQQQTATENVSLVPDIAVVPVTEPVVDQQKSQIIAQGSSGVVGDTLGEVNRLRQQLLIDPLIQVAQPSAPVAAPGSSAGTPTAYGASWRQGYIGGGAYFPLDEGRVDGSLSVGFGLGDPVKSVGVEVSVDILSVGGPNNRRVGFDGGDFADSGNVGFKIHKYLPDGTAVAVGWSNPIKWGDGDDSKETIYGVVTKSFEKLTVSLGVGSGVFRSKGALKASENSANVFAGVGYRVIPQASLIGSWTGNSLNLGASFAPFKQLPIVVNTIFTDVTDNLDQGVGFSLSAGYTFQF